MASSNGNDTATFIYNSEQVSTIEITNAQFKDNTELIRWFFTHLKVFKYNDVQEIVKSYIVSNFIELYRYNIYMIRPLYIYPNSRSSESKIYGLKQP